jgi:spore coat polysaccharide biosynthesis predicted glycosyltransferase SpsG
VLSSSHAPDDWEKRYTEEEIVVQRLELAESPLADWCVIDVREPERDEALTWAHGRSDRLLIIDDLSRTSSDRFLLTLNQNLGSLSEKGASDGRVLLGPRYALLRREIRNRLDISAAADHRRPALRRGGELRMLVSLGGMPDDELNRFAEEVLSDDRLSGLEKRVLVDVDDVGSEMAEADIALAAAGTTAWELCAFGVPTVLMVVAEDQRAVALPLAEHGAATYVGEFGKIAPSDVVSALAALAVDQDRREELGRTASALVDGNGALRVATRLRADMLLPRHATKKDARMLWEWANDPLVRNWSFSAQTIGWSDHLTWLDAVIEDPARELYVVEDERGTPVGQVRFDAFPEGRASPGATSEISYSIASTSRGLGWGGAIIDCCVRRYFSDTQTASIIARTLPGNMRSMRALVAADFDEDDLRADVSGTWQELRRDRLLFQ